jgi:hypothetical protein
MTNLTSLALSSACGSNQPSKQGEKRERMRLPTQGSGNRGLAIAAFAAWRAPLVVGGQIRAVARGATGRSNSLTGAWAAFGSFGPWARGLVVFGRRRPPERVRRGRVELRQGGAQQVDARGAWEPALLDGALEGGRYCGALGRRGGSTVGIIYLRVPVCAGSMLCAVQSTMMALVRTETHLIASAGGGRAPSVARAEAGGRWLWLELFVRRMLHASRGR